MVIVVDVDGRTVSLQDPDDVKRFHVAAAGRRDEAALAAAIGDLGRVDGDEVWVRVPAVRAMAAGRVSPSWEDDFAGMLEYARSKGWLDDTGDSVKAHVEWTG